ncbi:lipoprotein [Mesoplasma photuris]|uniref:lipoprotein n=1 Tax=Mesoplasma photuris TaxID=217731 RepID=UPI0004E25B12|nr:lipoprotein [Mesoplasma photuris]
MRKLIAILGAITLSAATTSTVMACSSDKTDSRTFDQVENWINSTKATFNADGTVNEKASHMILYIGAKDNASAKSFERMLAKTVGLDPTASIKTISEKINSTNNETLKELLRTDVILDKEYDTSQGIYNVKWDEDKGTWKTDGALNNSISLSGVGPNKQVEGYLEPKIEFQGINIEKSSDLWNEGATAEILNWLVEESIARVFLSQKKETGSQDWKTELEPFIDTIKEKVKELKGPVFLIIKNGTITGATSGFATTQEGLTDLIGDKDPSRVANLKSEDDDLINDQFEKWIDDVRSNYYNKETGNFEETAQATFTKFNSGKIQSTTPVAYQDATTEGEDID